MIACEATAIPIETYRLTTKVQVRGNKILFAISLKGLFSLRYITDVSASHESKEPGNYYLEWQYEGRCAYSAQFCFKLSSHKTLLRFLSMFQPSNVTITKT